MKDLPPLNALRPFIAVAAHGSFAAGAAELGLTEGAVRHHVGRLEKDLGCLLFDRGSNRISITPEGEAFARAVREGLNILELASARFAGEKEGKEVRIAAPELVVKEWLLPREASFNIRGSGVSLVYIMDNTRNLPPQHSQNPDLDLDGGEFDAAIRLAAKGAEWQGCDATPLFDERVYPMASRRLLDGRQPINGPSDLLRHVLVESHYRSGEWQKWFAALGIPVEPETLHVERQVTQDLVRASSVAGGGVALLNPILVKPYLDNGALVRLLDIPFDGRVWYFVTSRERRSAPEIRAVRDWMTDESRVVSA